MRGMPLAKSPMTVQTGGEGRYRYRNRNVNEAVTPLLTRCFFCPAFSAFSYSDSSRVLSTFCYNAIVETGFSFVKDISLILL